MTDFEDQGLIHAHPGTETESVLTALLAGVLIDATEAGSA